MPTFKTNLEIIAPTNKEIANYYKAATKKINFLFKKYNIRNIKNKYEKVSVAELQALLSYDGFFQATPLKAIFFEQKQQFVPQEIIYSFRSIISNPPASIKAVFFDTFITLLTKKGWINSLSTYFVKHHNVPPDSIILLDDLQDFSLGCGVYRITCNLRIPRREKIIVFLKKSCDIDSCNELLYFNLQKKLLLTAIYADPPYRLVNKNSKEELLLAPLVAGVSSDTAFSMLAQAYRKTKNLEHKFNLKIALETLIEAFIKHAVLGDLLGRNDRHLMNSLITIVVDGKPQTDILENLNNPDKIYAYTKNIVTNKENAISLIDIDMKWLLGEKNADWSLADIDFGLSEINLLSLLPAFSNYNLKKNPFFEKRIEYVKYYFDVYCQTLVVILDKKELLFSAIKKIYPCNVWERKLNILMQRIIVFENNRGFIIKLFKRYLQDFRTRLVYKATLIALNRVGDKTNNKKLLNALKEANLLAYLPPQATFASYESSISLQLQCFRGVLSNKDIVILSENNRIAWETIASSISMIAEKFNTSLFKALKNKEQFITQDTTALIKILSQLN